MLMVNEVVRHIKLYAHLMRLSAMMETEYRFSFLLEVLVEIAFFLATIVSFQVIFANVSEIAGWDRYHIAVLYGINMVFSEIILGLVFIFNLRELPHKIIRGQIDIILTRPVNSLFAATLWRPYFAFIPSAAAGIVLAAWGFIRGNIEFLPLNVIPFSLFFISGLIIAYSVGTMISCLSFWFKNAEPLPYLAQQFIFIAKHPFDVYRGIWRVIFMVVIPTAFMVTFPTRALVGNISLFWIVPSLLLAFIFLSLTRLVWSYGLKSYESASG
jgi:ABC-2 type transport system permease protein